MAGWIPGALIAGVLVVAVTELLGLFGLIARVPVGMVWVTVGVGCLVSWYRRRPTMRSQPGHLVSSFLRAPVTWSFVSLLLGLTFVTGFFGAPNVWDGLTYHLPRVERWVEQGHLGFWPTSVDRQLWMAPWNGYAILQFRLLTGGDRLAFLPSWLAYFGCILVTARVVRQLGGDERQAAFGALVMASTPVAVLHASSVQTDLTAAFWVLCVAALTFEAWQRKEAAGDWRHATWIGLAVGLAVATKGTVLLALVPWLVLYVAAVMHWNGWRALTRPLLVVACAVLVLNGAHFARNMTVFGDPLGDATTRGYLLLTPWTVGGAIANLTANASLHIGAPWAAWNESWTDVLILVQRKYFGTDPTVLYPYFGGFRVQRYSTHESLAGNPVHLLLGVGVLLLLLAGRWRVLRDNSSTSWVVAGLAAVVLHMFMVRWQPYGARLQLASLVWLAPAAAVVLRGWMVRGGVAAAAVLIASPGLVGNYLRPLLGERSVWGAPRAEQYFAERRVLRPVYWRATDKLAAAGCRSAGLVGGYDTPEYLLRVGRDPSQPRLRLRHIMPRSQSSVMAAPSSPDDLEALSCGVLVIDRTGDAEAVAAMFDLRLAWVDQGVVLFLPR